MTSHPPFTLISHVLCPYVQRAIIVLTEKVIPFRRIDVDLSSKPAWFHALSPLGKVPVLQVGNGVVFESAVIVEYLDEVTAGTLHLIDPLEKARHRSWIEFASATLNTIAGFYAAPNTETLDAKRLGLMEKFQWLERNLTDGPFFAGNRFCLVDAAWAPVFRYLDAFERMREPPFLAGTPKVASYRASLAGRPSVVRAVAPDYPDRLDVFLQNRGSALSRRMPAAV